MKVKREEMEGERKRYEGRWRECVSVGLGTRKKVKGERSKVREGTEGRR